MCNTTELCVNGRLHERSPNACMTFECEGVWIITHRLPNAVTIFHRSNYKIYDGKNKIKWEYNNFPPFLAPFELRFWGRGHRCAREQTHTHSSHITVSYFSRLAIYVWHMHIVRNVSRWLVDVQPIAVEQLKSIINLNAVACSMYK